jgi:hypothetical protein
MTLLSRITVFLLCLGIVSFIAPSTTHAASFTAVQSGNWNDTATWGGTIPGNADIVTIPTGITVTIPAITVNREFITSIYGTLINNGTLTSSLNFFIEGTFTNKSGATFTTSSNVYNWGTFNNAGTFTITGGGGGIGNGGPEHAGTLNNSGVVINNRNFNNYRTLNNTGSITNNHAFMNYCTGTISGNAIIGNPMENMPSMVATPSLGIPAHRAHITNTTPNFSWNGVSGAQSYRLMVYREDHSFEFKKRVFTNNYTLDVSEALSTGRYLWRVRSQDAMCSDWSGWSQRSTLFID